MNYDIEELIETMEAVLRIKPSTEVAYIILDKNNNEIAYTKEGYRSVLEELKGALRDIRNNIKADAKFHINFELGDVIDGLPELKIGIASVDN